MYAVALMARRAAASDAEASPHDIHAVMSAIKNFEVQEGNLEHSYTSPVPGGFDAVLFFSSTDSREALRQARLMCRTILIESSGSEVTWRVYCHPQEIHPPGL
ncbi:hypothetical protein ACFC1R_18640 [Kitasatospora sp. NPDC056138]|uniref:hypothetical protein n=1 Tax=Kitasatospora sp. NPDC056138 TaxID=3345724 RepID=UPI0035E08C44